MKKLTISTSKEREVIDITEELEHVLEELEIEQGVCHVFVAHTTAAITTADLDPGTDKDMLEAYYGMLPHIQYKHPHDPEHAPDHILTSLIGPSVTVPVKEFKLVLGTWQRVVLFEFDGPRERDVYITTST